MIIKLTDADRSAAHRIAEKRCGPKLDAGFDYTVDKSRRTLVLNYLGALAEMATARALHVDIDWNMYGTSGDGGIDLVFQGLHVQVKHNHYNFGDLYLPVGVDPTANIYVLVLGTEQSMRLAGYAVPDDFRTKSELINYGYGPNNAIPQNRLRNIDDLLALGGS